MVEPLLGRTWTHKIVLPFAHLLARISATPNQVTTVRLVSGLAACAAFAVGDRSWDIWGGWLWVLSAFLDRADGELARVTGKGSPWGHRYDAVCDILVTTGFFVGASIGLRDSFLGPWALPLGLAGGLGVFAAQMLAEVIDQAGQETGEVTYPGIAGFDFDDLLYLFAGIVWLGWTLPFIAASSVGAPVFALLTYYRLKTEKRAIKTGS